MRRHRPVVVTFDLDDTLYLERDFVRSGFRAAGVWFEQATGIAGLEQRCLEAFSIGQRERIFDTVLEQLSWPKDESMIGRLVDVYRYHVPVIELAPDAHEYLQRRSPHRRWALLSDGTARTQQSKARALGLDRLLDHLVFTDMFGREFWKPHPRGFEAIESWAAEECLFVYVADNPTKDFVTPRARGWLTVRVARDGRIHKDTVVGDAYAPHATISGLQELDACLGRLDIQLAPGATQ